MTEIGNLWHLEGRKVAILANGMVIPEQTVTNGKITLTTAASRVHVGLKYISEMETLRIDTAKVGKQSQGRKKKVSKLDLHVENTLGGWAGPDRDHMHEIKYGLPALYGQPNDLITALKALTLSPSWNKDGIIVLQQRDPLPMTILAIIPEVTVGN